MPCDVCIYLYIHLVYAIFSVIQGKEDNHPMKGKHWPMEVRQKIRTANLGQKRTDKTRANISKGLKKHWRELFE
ncbi:MAG: NUMOD3 domain-containing DNA-binding protein [Nitrososphaeraceae archaeon]